MKFEYFSPETAAKIIADKIKDMPSYPQSQRITRGLHWLIFLLEYFQTYYDGQKNRKEKLM